jgi:NADH dehydrogenase [ubiquinone] 1 alpha subcomplex assembly factor 7
MMDRRERTTPIDGDDRFPSHREPHLFGKLSNRRRTHSLILIPEPPSGQGSVRRVDGASREGHVSREEPMVECSFDHEHLRSVRAVTNPDQRCRLADLIAHGDRCYPGARTLEPVDARNAVAGAIRDHGPITFAEYMELALYGPGGFFEHPPVGPEGHFVTSPHVHPVFAELLGRAIVDLHASLGEPHPLRLTEVGAGDGTLARQLIEHLRGLDVEYTAVETSPGARRALEATDGIRVAERLEGSSQLILANELMDNLPFRRFRGTASGTKEVMVGLDGERFVEHLRDPPPGDGAALADGEEVVLPEGAIAFVDELATRLAHPGYALLIDYGGVGEPGGPAHGYRAHRPVEDLLDRPGSTDITCGLDFKRLGEHAERQGLIAFPSVTQRHALTTLGFDRWIHEELGRQAALLDARDGLAAVRTWSGRSRAMLLVDPTALGRLRWLLLATSGLHAPPWV